MTNPPIVLRPVKMTEQLVEHLARAIVSRELPPGSQLPSESDLVARFGISKAGVREAISTLVAVGLVQVQHGKRTMVRNPQDWALLSPVVQHALRTERGDAYVLNELFEIRLILEAGVAGLAATRASDDAIADLETLIEQLRSVASTTRDASSFLEIDLLIHEGIALSVGNLSLSAMARDLLRQMPDNWLESRMLTSEMSELAEEHAEIVQAIVARDPDRARTAMAKHIGRAWEVEVGRRRQAGPATASGAVRVKPRTRILTSHDSVGGGS